MTRTLIAACGLLALAAAVVGLTAAGDTARRPEGAAERLLHALSIDEPDRAARWAAPAVTDPLIAFEADDDTRFATIEVGRATVTGDHAVVPARIVRNDAEDTSQALHLTAVRADRDWRITAVEPVDRATVPSTGGDRPARAPLSLWAALAVLAVLAAFAGDVLITRLRATGAAT